MFNPVLKRFAHSDEAMLAILAIFVWHFYNVHFSPNFFPMNLVWYNGRLTRKQMEEEHPLELEKLEQLKDQNITKGDHGVFLDR